MMAGVTPHCRRQRIAEGVGYGDDMPIEHPTDDDIAAALGELVDDSINERHWVLLVADRERNYQVLFTKYDDSLVGKLHINPRLARAHRPSIHQLAMLRSMGWNSGVVDADPWIQAFPAASRDDCPHIVAAVRGTLAAVGREAGISLEYSWEGPALPDGVSIAFASEAHRTAYGIVVSAVGHMDDIDVIPDQRESVVYIRYGTVVVSAAVQPVEPESTIIDLSSLLVQDVDVTDDLMRWLLLMNHDARFGAFSLNGDGDVVWSHSLVGDTITEHAFTITLSVFLTQADGLDDQIVERFGGYTARDRPSGDAG